VKAITRQFVYLRPDLFVVFDQVTAAKAEYPKTWLLHSIEEPPVEGNRFIIKHGEGQLFGYTLLPAKARIEKVGGPGKEFWVAGKNYPVSANAEAGAWRIEVAPPSAREIDFFLHVLYAADEGASPPDEVRLLTEGLKPGEVACGIEVGGKRYVAMFQTQDQPGGGVLIEEADTGTDLFAGALATTVSE